MSACLVQVAHGTKSVAELDAGVLDHLGPLGRLFLDDRRKLGWRVADRLESKFVELLAHLRHRQGLDGLAVQFIQNILRRAGRREQAEPRHGLEAGNPDSAMVGRSGASAERLIEVMASARNFPSRASGTTFTILANDMVMRLASRSGINAVVPR